MKITLKSKVSTLEGYSYGEREAGSTLRNTLPPPRAKTKTSRPGDHPHSHSASGVPLVDPGTTSRIRK